MKKNILRVISLVLVAGMLFAFCSCTQEVQIRFVDKDGEDLDLSQIGAAAGSVAPAPSGNTAPAPSENTAPATTVASENTDTAAPAPENTDTAAPAPSGSVPSTKEEIAEFYRTAINKVKNDGAAGYVKKEWQTISNLNITGSSMVDGKVAEIVGGYMTTEDAAENQNSDKGSDDAKNRFPSFTVTDMNNIESATCTVNGSGNYAITIKSIVEDTPKKEGSMMSTFTSSYLAWEDITTEIDNNVSIVKDYKDTTHLMYNVLIEAEITPDGKFVSMKHTTACDIKIESAKILIVTLKDKQAHLDNLCTYTNFVY